MTLNYGPMYDSALCVSPKMTQNYGSSPIILAIVRTSATINYNRSVFARHPATQQLGDSDRSASMTLSRYLSRHVPMTLTNRLIFLSSQLTALGPASQRCAPFHSYGLTATVRLLWDKANTPSPSPHSRTVRTDGTVLPRKRLRRPHPAHSAMAATWFTSRSVNPQPKDHDLRASRQLITLHLRGVSSH